MSGAKKEDKSILLVYIGEENDLASTESPKAAKLLNKLQKWIVEVGAKGIRLNLNYKK